MFKRSRVSMACVVALGAIVAAPTMAQSPGVATSQGQDSQRIEVTVAGGKASGHTGRVSVAVGTSVTLVVTSDAADEVHVHGYDKEAELSPGQPAEIRFDATIPGVFEVELHEAGTLLCELQVQ